MASIEATQKEIVQEFALLEEDREMTMVYVMELGQKLPPMDEQLKIDDNLIKGCQSKVWINATLREGRVFFQADSNTSIVKGLASLLVRVFSGQTPDDILQSDLTFVKHINMDRFIGTQRSNGIAAMTKQMKLYALALKTQLINNG